MIILYQYNINYKNKININGTFLPKKKFPQTLSIGYSVKYVLK